jgi:hypothetical protein
VTVERPHWPCMLLASSPALEWVGAAVYRPRSRTGYGDRTPQRSCAVHRAAKAGPSVSEPVQNRG